MAKLEAPRRAYLGKVAGLPVYTVSGQWLRNHVDIDFTQGGNEAVYPSYVPEGEIWIDDNLRALDRMATALHEIVERDQMMRLGKDYDDAHEVASANERPFRRELERRPPRTFDTKRVAAAYKAYRRDPGKHPVIDRPDDPPRSGRQMDREIEEFVTRGRG